MSDKGKRPKPPPGFKWSESALLMTGAQGQFSRAPQLLELLEKPNQYGVRSTEAGWLAMLTFEGVDTDDLQGGRRTQRIATALPDLVLLHATLGALIDQAVAGNLLHVPAGFSPIVSRQDGPEEAL